MKKKKIYTHLFIDLDAVLSVWAVKTFIKDYEDAEIVFVSANWNGDGLESGDIAVDIEASGKGFKGMQDSDNVLSAFSGLIKKYASEEDQGILEPLARFADLQDTTGSVVSELIPSETEEIQKILKCANINVVLRALQRVHPNNDLLVCKRMFEIFDGILEMGRANKKAHREAERAEIIGKVAILRDSKEITATQILFYEKGVRVIVYVDGNNLGLIRHRKESLRMDSIRDLIPKEEKWFSHPSGFLFCWGSKKAPAQKPSKVNPKILAEAINTRLS